jgi:hypothetical protein
MTLGGTGTTIDIFEIVREYLMIVIREAVKDPIIEVGVVIGGVEARLRSSRLSQCQQPVTLVVLCRRAR